MIDPKYLIVGTPIKFQHQWCHIDSFHIVNFTGESPSVIIKVCDTTIISDNGDINNVIYKYKVIPINQINRNVYGQLIVVAEN